MKKEKKGNTLLTLENRLDKLSELYMGVRAMPIPKGFPIMVLPQQQTALLMHDISY